MRNRSPNPLIRLLKLIVYLFLLLILIILVWKNILSGNTKKNVFASPLPSQKYVPSVLPLTAKNRTYVETLNSSLENILPQNEGSYGIVVKNLKTGESFQYNAFKKFAQGSLYKLWLMAAAFQQIEAGKLNGDSVVSADVADLNKKYDLDPNTAELTDGTVTLTVNQAVEQMITISNNYAAYLLYDAVGLDNVTKLLKTNNLTDSRIGNPPVSTPFDMALFLEKLYRSELAGSADSQKMLEILKNQTRNGKLPKYLPESVVIGHKTGEIDTLSHDAGIVLNPAGGDYIIVIMSDSDDPSQADDQIGKISKAVYDYFIKS